MSLLAEPPRTPVDRELVARLVETQFPEWAKLPVTAIEPGGWDNWTFRLGEDKTIRLPSAERYAAQVEKEQLWLPRLAAQLPLPIPQPLAIGEPAFDYPWRWSIYGWIEGEPLSKATPEDMEEVALGLAQFLNALYQTETTNAPSAGTHNFHRGGHPSIYDGETREALQRVSGSIDAPSAIDLWERATNTQSPSDPVWVHGDLNPGNLLLNGGRLSAVIDFGSSAIGDPACDLAAAWTLFTGSSRSAFMDALPHDDGTWLRSRAWVLWKAAKTLTSNGSEDKTSIRLIEDILRE